jgi:phage terminase large subunit-like protein
LVNFSEEGFGIGLVGRTLPTAWDMAVKTVEDSDVTFGKSKEKAGAN